MGRFRTFVLASVALLCGTPGLAEVHEVRDDGFITRDTVTVKATALETWLALTKPGDWWGDEHTWSGDAGNMTLTPQGGGCFCETIPGSDGADGFQLSGSVMHGTVVQATPLKLLRLIGSLGPLQSEPVTGILTFALKEVDGGTQVQMEYHVGGTMRFKAAEMAPLVDKVLSQQLGFLRDHLGPLGDGPTEPGEEPALMADEPSVEEQIDALGEEH